MGTDVLDDTAESAVRNYLLFLENPSKLIDQELVGTLRKKAEQTDDPIERLKIYAEIDRAESSDETKYRRDFVRHAKAWAEANKVGVAAFRQLKVGDDVLRSAGLLATPRGVAKQRKQASISSRGSVTAEAIKAHVRGLHGKFTMADIQSSIGGSPMTVRKGVQALVLDGTIKRLGPTRDWRGRGRAPIEFEVT
jgi:hypothetical protein